MQAMKNGSDAWAAGMGRHIGEALAGGIAEGLRGALASLQDEIAPLGHDLAQFVRARALSGLDASGEGERLCHEAGCGRRAIARGLCRRHYARQAYREKKERTAGSGERPERRPRAARVHDGDDASEPLQRVVAPVAPIIRRRRSEEAAAAAAVPGAMALQASAAHGEPVAEPPAAAHMPPAALVPNPDPDLANAIARNFGVKV